MSFLDLSVLLQEIGRACLPGPFFSTVVLGGLPILDAGNEEQKQRYLPKIASGEAIFTLALTETSAQYGADSVKTKAISHNDEYVISGQKVWTSGAHHVNYLYVLARTDTEAPKHKGISEFIMKVDTPGVEVRPLVDITNTHHFNEVFFDGARVPKRYLIGEKNAGFYQVVQQLAYERSGIERLMDNYPMYSALLMYVKETKRRGQVLSKDPTIRQRMARLKADFEVGRLLIYRVAQILDEGRSPVVEAAMAKAHCTTFEKRLASVATEILGLYGQLLADSKYAPMAGMVPYAYMMSFGYSIQGGTTEILKNIIAERGLGLSTK